MRQAAEIFLVQILEQDSLAGIVRFDSSAVILQHLTLVSGLAVRTELARKLPTQASGGTNICEGLNKGFEVLREDDQDVAGTEIILLTDGEDSNVGSCLQTAQSSGVTIHTVALGPSADPLLEQFALRTGRDPPLCESHTEPVLTPLSLLTDPGVSSPTQSLS
uniref:VWFA domain-containing protein n=1 Tax=Lepisosteus oculatus TaxID=7918 RepID=W5ND02_LEPOC